MSTKAQTNKVNKWIHGIKTRLLIEEQLNSYDYAEEFLKDNDVTKEYHKWLNYFGIKQIEKIIKDWDLREEDNTITQIIFCGLITKLEKELEKGNK